MLPEPGLYLLLTFLGGWVAVDGTSWGQFMVSRPFVAATLAGWAAGNATAGLAIGLVLEAFHLTVLPVGAARYPEGGPPAVVAGALFAASELTAATLLPLVVLGLGWEWVSGQTVRYMRIFNIRLVRGEGAASAGALERRHRAAILVDFARGALLVAVGVALQVAILAPLSPHWALDEGIVRLLLVGAVVGLLAGALRLFPGRGALFVAGALAALAFRIIGR